MKIGDDIKLPSLEVTTIDFMVADEGQKMNKCIDCQCEISRVANRCHSCAAKGERNSNWKGGPKKNYCKCGKEIPRYSNRCRSCANRDRGPRPESTKKKISGKLEGIKLTKIHRESISIGVIKAYKDPTINDRRIETSTKLWENPTDEMLERILKNGRGTKCYYNGEFFPSLQERDCYIWLNGLMVKIVHNFLGRFDFLINDSIVLEYHPYDVTKLTQEQYYNARRKLLDKLSCKDLKLIVMVSLKDKEKIKIENKIFMEG